MSSLSGTYTDLIFANTLEGTALATFTAEASLLAGMNGVQPMLPGGFFAGLQQGTSKTLRLWARGIVSSTATPTYTLFVRLGTTQGVITGTSVGQSAAITTGSGISNQIWELEMDLTVQTVGYGAAAATMECSGLVSSPGFASPFFYAVTPAASATAWTATFDASVTQFLSLSAACSASSASNTIKLKHLLVMALN